MFDPTNPGFLANLGLAISHSRWKLRPFRENRMTMLKQFVGANYSDSGASKKVPINLLQLAINIYQRQLVPASPRAMVSTKDPQIKPIAADWQSWMDKATVGMKLADTIRGWVQDALMSIGILKVGEAHVGDIEIQGMLQHIGQPFAERVDLDDWVMDITAKRFDQIQFCGNRWRVPLEEAKYNPMFDAVERAKLSAMTKMAYNERGDLRTTTLQQSTANLQQQDVVEHVELWDIWYPKEKLILTLPYQDSVEGGFSGKPLRIVRWQGPNQGPYLLLSYCDVPNNVMSAAPAQSWLDLHMTINAIYRKLFRQALRQKTILAVQGGAVDDADTINKTDDGMACKVNQAGKIEELSYGGVHNENMLIAEQFKQIFVYMAGNLDSIGGLSPQAQTLGQDRLLSENSSAQIKAMKDVTTAGISGLFNRLAWQWWSNPHLRYDTSRSIEGEDVPASITPQMRQLPFEKLEVSIDPYSMQEDTPQTRLALIKELLQTVIMPMMPIMQQQGGQLQIQGILELFEKYGNFPDLPDIVKFGPPPDQQAPEQITNEALKPPETTRNVVRTSRPGMTANGQSQVMQQLLAGGGQPKQAAMVGRKVG